MGCCCGFSNYCYDNCQHVWSDVALGHQLECSFISKSCHGKSTRHPFASISKFWTVVCPTYILMILSCILLLNFDRHLNSSWNYLNTSRRRENKFILTTSPGTDKIQQLNWSYTASGGGHSCFAATALLLLSRLLHINTGGSCWRGGCIGLC